MRIGLQFLDGHRGYSMGPLFNRFGFDLRACHRFSQTVSATISFKSLITLISSLTFPCPSFAQKTLFALRSDGLASGGRKYP